jgi:hypothetical protein
MRIFCRILIFIIAFASCRKESYYESSDAALRFSADSVKFDTVFSSIGSATKRLIVYNPYNKTLRVSAIRLAGGINSSFIINVNGLNTTEVNDIEINPKDSLYIFIQVYVNPSGENQPLLLRDSLLFNVNNNSSNVKLEAFGQDVHLMKAQTLKTQTWDADKPYLIYGDQTVDSLQTLTILEGATVYFHTKTNLIVKGTLTTNGSFAKPVHFRSDRLEKEYDDVPGQWGGVILLPGSNGNKLTWTVLENGTSGIQIGQYNDHSKPDVSLSNTTIQNMAYNCMLAIGSKIKATNCLFANASTYTCGLIGGGEYEFYNCTIAGYYTGNRSGTYPSLYISNFYSDPTAPAKTVVNDLAKASFINTLVYGYNTSEIKLDSKTTAAFQYQFDHCLLKSPDYKTLGANAAFTNMLWNKDPKFHSTDSLKFDLNETSPAKAAGDVETGSLYPLDLKNKDRRADKIPSIGAYE